jgi:arylsulfatase A-like enzyme
MRVGAFHIQNRLFYNYFKNDAQIAFNAFEDNILQSIKNYDSSLFLGSIFRLGTSYDQYLLNDIYRGQYVGGMPTASGEIFLLDHIVDGAIELLGMLTKPGLFYLHFYPPHEPYSPKRKFSRKFEKDGWKPEYKERHPLSQEMYTFLAEVSFRAHYDEYLASWDDEFGRVYEYLETSGLLENSYIFITSDHGEMFERGETGHFTPLIYDPLIKIPLLISRPGQTKREDIYINTSNVDILPTLTYITGNQTPNWIEGKLLPGFGDDEAVSRSIYTVDAKTNSAFTPLEKFSVSLTKDRYRLTYYKYPDYENFEFYDLDNDPDEIDDLFSRKPLAALDIQSEMLDKLADVNRPYRR